MSTTKINGIDTIDSPKFRKFFLSCAGTLIWEERAFIQRIKYIDAHTERAVLAEREAIAKLVDSVGHNWSGAPAHAFFDLADNIRART